MSSMEKIIQVGGLNGIEKTIISVLGYYEVLVEINGISFWRLLNENNQVVGYAEYIKSTDTYHIRINVPGFWLDITRQRGSKKLNCEYQINFGKKGEAILRLK